MTARLPASQRDELIAKALEELLDGASITQIAETHGISRSTLHSWLLGEVPERYRDIQSQGLIARIVSADEDIDASKSHLDVARAREKAKFARWDAERRLKRLFAPSQEISGPGGGPIQVMDNLERARRLAYIQSMLHPPPIEVTPTIVSSSS